MGSLASFFSSSYFKARKLFRDLAIQNNAVVQHYEIGHLFQQQQLTIDVARFGSPTANKCLVVSSGTHGVEGFLGSAIQSASMNKGGAATDDLSIVYIHAVNPFGFANIRRVNELNVDLNRNFMSEEQPYKGADPGYSLMDPLLNPTSPPPAVEFFWPRAALKIARHGFNALKNSVAQGQYEYPKGLFFGGKKPSASMNIIAENLGDWIGDAQRIIHLDLHSGLGKWGSYVLGSTKEIPAEKINALSKYFGTEALQTLDPKGVLYEIRGEFGVFCHKLFPQREYIPFLAEFGTYFILKVLYALRYENRVWHWSPDDLLLREKAAEMLKEAFVPESPQWRKMVVDKGQRLIAQAIQALQSESTTQ